jgi:hypothetical protein
LLIETKADDDMFEEYDPDTLYLRVIKYVEGEEYNISRPDSLPTQVIKVNKKKDKVSDLDSKLGEMFGIPSDRVVVLLRHGDRTELYNMAWRKPKHIEDASRLDHGAILYVEEGDP